MSKAVWWLLLAAVVAGGLLWARAQARDDTLAPGMPAPDFALPDAQGATRTLGDFRGEWLLLYFYPKDGTPVCTRQACVLRDGYQELRARGVRVVGVSLDDGASHRAFADKHRLPFPLLSDRDGATAASYGALWSLGPIRIARRHSFLIDPQGRLARIYRKIEVDSHYRQVLDDLAEVQNAHRD